MATDVSSVTAADTRGKHRILAELKRLEQETRSLEDELEELEKTEKVSAACQELLLKIESRPDPLLPVTTGPANPYWDRWFEGPQDSQGHLLKVDPEAFLLRVRMQALVPVMAVDVVSEKGICCSAREIESFRRRTLED